MDENNVVTKVYLGYTDDFLVDRVFRHFENENGCASRHLKLDEPKRVALGIICTFPDDDKVNVGAIAEQLAFALIKQAGQDKGEAKLLINDQFDT